MKPSTPILLLGLALAVVARVTFVGPAYAQDVPRPFPPVTAENEPVGHPRNAKSASETAESLESRALWEGTGPVGVPTVTAWPAEYVEPLETFEPLAPPMSANPTAPLSVRWVTHEMQIPNPMRFATPFTAGTAPFDVGLDLYSAPNFNDGLIIYGDNVAMKLGGYVKADFIYDFDPIDSTDAFDTTTIPVGAPHRTNARFHARQSRLSFDTRWASNTHTVRIFVEGDFFSEGDRFRLRHAYGHVGSVLVGQTWTTFTDVAAIPPTLDIEGSVSAIQRRQAQARWTQSILFDGLTYAIAIEDTRFIIETPEFGIWCSSNTVTGCRKPPAAGA